MFLLKGTSVLVMRGGHPFHRDSSSEDWNQQPFTARNFGLEKICIYTFLFEQTHSIMCDYCPGDLDALRCDTCVWCLLSVPVRLTVFYGNIVIFVEEIVCTEGNCVSAWWYVDVKPWSTAEI